MIEDLTNSHVFSNPECAERWLCSLRGIIIKQSTRKIDFWSIEKPTPFITVYISRKQQRAFNDIRQKRLGISIDPDDVFDDRRFYVLDTDEKKYPIGGLVGITFGFANKCDQHSLGVMPLIVTKLELMRPDTKLPNEIGL